MDRSDFRRHTTLGRTELVVSRIALAGGYKIPAVAVERAHEEFGVNTFYWAGRKPGMGDGLRGLLARRRREDLVIAIQTYDHLGFWVRGSVERALRALEIERVDLLFLGWHNRMPRRRLIDRALELKEEGHIRFLGVTGHDRRFHGEVARSEDSPFDVHLVRYSAAHRGAETDVFNDLPDGRPGLATYTATRWGRLLRPDRMPEGEPPLTAADCYRFALSHPAVDLCLAGPRTEEEMVDGLAALSGGPLTPGEAERVRRIGDHVHG